MSNATDRAVAALDGLASKAVAKLSARSASTQADKDFEDQSAEVDVSIAAIQAEKQSIVDGTK